MNKADIKKPACVKRHCWLFAVFTYELLLKGVYLGNTPIYLKAH